MKSAVLLILFVCALQAFFMATALPTNASTMPTSRLSSLPGMNDGEYHPFDQATFDKFAAGYEHIVDRLTEKLPAVRIRPRLGSDTIGWDTPDWTQSDSALPYPIAWDDPTSVVPLAVHSSDFLETLDKQRLAIVNQKAAHYVLAIDGSKVGTFASNELNGLRVSWLCNVV